MTTSTPHLTTARERAAGNPEARRGIRAWWSDVVEPLAWPLLRPVGRVTRAVTGLGWSVIAATGGALAAGLGWGWDEFLVMGLIGAAVLVISGAYLVGRIAYDATLNLSLTRVVVGERAVGGIELRNPTKRALLPVLVELPVGKGIATFAIPRLGAGQAHDDVFMIPTARRAVLKVGPITAVRGDPLGLMARVVTWTDPVDLYVHPQTVRLTGSSAGFLQDLEGLPTKDLSSSDISFHALREYVPGDDRRHVHWKSTARTGVLMVRQFEETRRSHLAISLSLNGAEYATEDEFELGISIAGSLGLQALREDKQLSVLVQGGHLPTRSGKQFLDSLSGLDNTDGRRGSMIDLALATGVAVPDASVAVLMCGTSVTPQDIRAAASHIPIGVMVVAVYCSPGSTVSRRNIGDIVVLSVGSLGDLPYAMRRVLS